EGGHVDGVRLLRVHADAADLARVAQGDARPRPPALRRPVDPVAMGDVAADAALAHPRVDDVGVRLRDRDRAHGARAELAVGDVAPADPAVRRLPDAAARAAEVIDIRLIAQAGYRDHAPATVGADGAPAQAAQQ